MSPHGSMGRATCHLPSAADLEGCPALSFSVWGTSHHKGVLNPRVCSTIASPLWLELRGRSAWEATQSWTGYRLACQRFLQWLWVTFAMVPDAAWLGWEQRPWGTAPGTGPVGQLGRPSASDKWSVVSCFPSLGRPSCARVCGVLSPLTLVHWCARPMSSCVRCL